MKKILASVLAMLLMFSVFSVAASAAKKEEEVTGPVTVVFVVDDAEYAVLHLPENVELKDYAPENPVKEETSEARYTFKGWLEKGAEDKGYFYKNTLPKTPVLAEGETEITIVYVADFSVKDLSGRQSFWNLVESVFERINIIFEYLATVLKF